jgi:hypothetical protein
VQPFYPKTAGNPAWLLRSKNKSHHFHPSLAGRSLFLMLRLSIAALTSPLLPTSVPAVRPHPRRLLRLRVRSLAAASSLSPSARSLRLLEWGKVCDAVASFAGTAHGRDATKVSRSDLPGYHFSQLEYRRWGFVSDARRRMVWYAGAETTVEGGRCEL